MYCVSNFFQSHKLRASPLLPTTSLSCSLDACKVGISLIRHPVIVSSHTPCPKLPLCAFSDGRKNFSCISLILLTVSTLKLHIFFVAPKTFSVFFFFFFFLSSDRSPSFLKKVQELSNKISISMVPLFVSTYTWDVCPYFHTTGVFVYSTFSSQLHSLYHLSNFVCHIACRKIFIKKKLFHSASFC